MAVKVWQLIEALKQLDPDLPVFAYDGHEGYSVVTPPTVDLADGQDAFGAPASFIGQPIVRIIGGGNWTDGEEL
jgi:hypothetical protein